MKKNIATIIALLIVTIAAEANAQKYFLKIEGPNLTGGSTTPLHIGEFILSNFSFGISNSGTTHTGVQVGAGAGKSQSGPILISLPFTAANNNLYKAIHNGQNFAKITIFVRKLVQVPDPMDKDYLVYEFENVKFSSVDSKYVANADPPNMNLTFKAGKFSIKYYKTLPGGGLETSPSGTMTYNFLDNSDN